MEALLPLPDRAPELGDLVFVRSRRWLVEDVEASAGSGPTIVKLACAEDDNQGQALEVFWELEPDRTILTEEGWQDIAARGFDPAEQGNPLARLREVHGIDSVILITNAVLVTAGRPRRGRPSEAERPVPLG